MAEQGRLGRAYEAFDRLSTREKVMVGGLITALLGTALTVVWMVVAGQIDELEIRNAEIRDGLTQLRERKDSFLAKRAKAKAAQERLDKNKLKLVSVMEKEARRLSVEVENFKQDKRYLTENYRRRRRRADDEGENAPKPKVLDLVEASQTATLNKITLKQLAGFMEKLEGQREPVRITRLSVTTSQADRQELRQVRMRVATYRMEEAEQ